MVATLPVARAPDSAFHTTVASCPILSLVASASAKDAEICSLVRSASWTKPDPLPELLPDPLLEAAAAPPPPAPPAPPEVVPEPLLLAALPPDDEPPTMPLTAMTVPSI